MSSTHPWPNLTKTTHRTEYAAISPLNPANSHAGKTVVVTAGATGVGLFISRGFLRAGARTVVLLARREAVLAEAAAGLRDEFGEKSSDGVDKVLTYAVDITDEDRVNNVFADVRRRINSGDDNDDGKKVELRRDIDILVLSAAYVDHGLPVLGYTRQSLRASFETNVLGNLNAVRAFVPEAAYMPVADMSGEVRAPVRTPPPPASSSPSSPSTTTSSSDRVIIAIADVMSYTLFPTQSLYGASKLPFHTFMLRHLDAELRQLSSATSPSTSRPVVRAHALHPGALLTPAGLDIGFTEQMFPWDDPSLPGGFATWLASDAGRFLRGRFVHATWDVDELVAMRGRFEEDADLAEVVLKV
ncbi:Short chain dehydrogenase andI [Lasiodiplodia hormozganensis]|uniref:Short chain dehydrogenase andI n=1 Tax=Lasiodiplodia hormozganensis TaxID=869390 RepID=A0AA40C8G4_9PEZI|nr:Short chain dehydrogenase andI [Lasiodiplodia hormozganensis]